MKMTKSMANRLKVILLALALAFTALGVSMFTSTDLMKIKQLSSRSFQSAQIIFATVPILLVYPFLQRYFITGLTIGAVKE